MSGCAAPGPDTGVFPVLLSDGTKAFFKRAATGVTGGHNRTALSLDGNRCHGPDSSVDHVFESDHAFPVFYSLADHRIELYVTMAISQPTKARWPIAVTIHTLTPVEAIELQASYRERNLSIADIRLEPDKCRFGFKW